jgi:hypothetical protein
MSDSQMKASFQIWLSLIKKQEVQRTSVIIQQCPRGSGSRMCEQSEQILFSSAPAAAVIQPQ